MQKAMEAKTSYVYPTVYISNSKLFNSKMPSVVAVATSLSAV
jgi:hypothetical protein